VDLQEHQEVLEPLYIPSKTGVVQDACRGAVWNEHYFVELPLLFVRIADLALFCTPPTLMDYIGLLDS
jgi:hypothetical protein